MLCAIATWGRQKLRTAELSTDVIGRTFCCTTLFCDYAMSVLSRWISMTLGRSIHQINENCCKGYQSQRSKVKVIVRPITMAETYISTMWRRGHLFFFYFYNTRFTACKYCVLCSYVLQASHQNSTICKIYRARILR